MTREGLSLGNLALMAGSWATLTFLAKFKIFGLRTASHVKLESALELLKMRVATAKGTENLAAKVLLGAGSFNSAAK